MSWVGWSRQRLCTNEVYRPRHIISSNMPSFKMLPTRHYYEVQDRTTTSASPRYWRNSSQRRLKDNLNCWRITILRQFSQRRLLAIGTRLVNEPASIQPMWKLSVTCVKGSHCSRRCLRRLNVPSAKSICTLPWEHR